jgi:hypothetical protein
MGDEIRSKDWSTTAIGPIDQWPDRLLVLVNAIIESKFPQFLFWGDDNISFYNDAYAPSLGSDVDHDKLLGASGAEFWGDIWFTVAKPQVDFIKRGGEPIWHEDQLIPIMRNGTMEDVYWTYSYSPVRNKSGNIYGALVTVMETTEKVNSFRVLEESRNQMSFGLKAADFASWEYKPETGELTGSENLKKWFFSNDYATGALTLDNAVKKIHPNDRVKVREAMVNAMDINHPDDYDIIYTICTPDQSDRIVRAFGRSHYDQEGKTERFNGLLQDITLQFNNEHEQRKLLSLFDASNELILLADPDGKITTANPAALKFLGWDNYNRKYLIDCIYKEDVENYLIQISNIGHQESFSMETRCWNAKTNETFWMLLNVAQIKDDQDKNVIALAISGSNITLQKQKGILLQQTNETLRESENRFKLLANNTPAFIMMSDIYGKVTFANKLWKEFVGNTKDQLIEESFFKYVHPDDVERCRINYDIAIKNSSEFKDEFRIKGRDGLYRWISNVGVPRFDGEGNFDGYTHASLNIQDLKLQEQQKDLFIGMASHELKTPITSMKGYIQLLRMKYGKSDDKFLVKTLQTVESQILVLTSLITDLLDLSKMKSGGLELNKTRFNFDVFIKDIIEQQQMIHPNHSYNYTDQLGLDINADKDRLSQVLINFLNNAVKYAPNSEKIDITASKNSGFLKVSVRDYGIGINTSNKEKVFKRFFREEGTDEKTFPGFGIGLFIASDIIKKHSGTIGVDSIKGEGATFYFSIPLITAHE